jgi:hypothetical protein
MSLLKRYAAGIIGPNATRQRITTWGNKLTEAISQYENDVDTSLVIVGKEYNETGSRNYDVMTFAQLWILATSERPASLYEIILPNSSVCMFVDFDLPILTCTSVVSTESEYAYGYIELVKSTLVEVSGISNEHAGILCGGHIILKSSDESKLSFHLVFPKLVMKTIAHAGALTRRICASVINEELPSIAEDRVAVPWYGVPLLYSFESNTGAKDVKCVIDACVYKRQQNFRVVNCMIYFLMLLGSKYAQNRKLEFHGELTLQAFIRTTVTGGIPIDSEIIEVTECDGSKPVVTDMSSITPKSLIPSSNVSLFGNSDPIQKVLTHFSEVLTVGVSGHVYFESADESAMIVIYTRDKNCYIKGSDHESNHVYYVVDLTKNRFFQKCPDETCRATKARSHILFE